ncbi:hypothetical protein L207DRAFT_575289 [Hyaloscypha variabilis F]|uniref:Uncharacterized protein n=1 Tax=Hyaloscypha variabilis (strain UAMH 11265 / GT02V1 / F) TaxID=1149755 RepID=A0A2J6SD15_HYAVF|nr:hypothetical protein L207DRAFT_575289 [Hyaloscypha variabilis F]
MFFYSWPLWEKMTFILGLAILGVFCIGYLKLLWMNRIVKKQEVVDEEKRTRIQVLRNSGQIVESRRSHDIPFGVRAIQSGITVDGIWISQSNTPIPSEIKLGHLRNGSSEVVPPHDSNSSAEAADEKAPRGVRLSSRQGKQQSSIDETRESNTDSLERQGTSETRLSYKPRKSSHLRVGSHGEYDAITLDHLEGKPSSSPKKIYTHRPRGSRGNPLEVDSSSAADNERSSGTSDESDATLSHHPKPRPRQSLLPQSTTQGEPLTDVSYDLRSEQVRASVPLQSSRTEYFSIPLGSPDSETSDPFATPMESPSEASRTHRPQTSAIALEASLLGEAQADFSNRARSVSPFVPGELHVNKTVRKVNSGFEVLPAGTFGTPAELKSGDASQDEESGERRQSKLQKKPRTSMTGQRQPGTTDRIFMEHVARNSG